eukprot:6195222-Pleurochrysis_carterae.AAC.1
MPDSRTVASLDPVKVQIRWYTPLRACAVFKGTCMRPYLNARSPVAVLLIVSSARAGDHAGEHPTAAGAHSFPSHPTPTTRWFGSGSGGGPSRPSPVIG